MLIRTSNDCLMTVDKIIRNEDTIEGWLHGKKKYEFSIQLKDSEEAQQIFSQIVNGIVFSNYVNIPSMLAFHEMSHKSNS